MEGINVGDYVRTDTKIGRVLKIKEENKYYRYVVRFKKRTTNVNEDSIKKHSPYIIDLIEVGDIVNESKVTGIMSGYVYLDKIDIETKKVKTLTDYQIKNIVTKEQFNQVKYEVSI